MVVVVVGFDCRSCTAAKDRPMMGPLRFMQGHEFDKLSQEMGQAYHGHDKMWRLQSLGSRKYPSDSGPPVIQPEG